MWWLAYLVGDHIGLGKVGGLPSSQALELIEKTGIEVHLGIAGAIKRPHRGVGKTTSRLHLPIEQHQLRGPIALDHLPPGVFQIPHDGAHKLAVAVVGGRALGCGGRGNGSALELREDIGRTDPKQQSPQQGQDHCPNADASRPPHAGATSPPVFYVLAPAQIFPFHASPLQSFLNLP